MKPASWMDVDLSGIWSDTSDYKKLITEPRSKIGERALQGEDKKIGVESGDPNRHSQPRLPGSVVGEASMQCG